MCREMFESEARRCELGSTGAWTMVVRDGTKPLCSELRGKERRKEEWCDSLYKVVKYHRRRM